MRSRLQYIGVLALILSVAAYVPGFVCSTESGVTADAPCCVMNSTGDTCCCGTTAACEFAPSTNDAEPATLVSYEYPVDEKTIPHVRVERVFSSDSAAVVAHAGDHIPRSLTHLRTTILLL